MKRVSIDSGHLAQAEAKATTSVVIGQGTPVGGAGGAIRHESGPRVAEGVVHSAQRTRWTSSARECRLGGLALRNGFIPKPAAGRGFARRQRRLGPV